MPRDTCAALLLAFAPLACSSPPATPGDLDQQIGSRYRELIESVTRRDFAVATGMHTNEAVLLPPDGRVLRGLDEIRAFIDVPLGPEIRNTKIDTLIVDGDERFAYEVGRYEYTVVDDAGNESVARGRYLMVWKRVDGVWQVAADMWDSDQ